MFEDEERGEDFARTKRESTERAKKELDRKRGERQRASVVDGKLTSEGKRRIAYWAKESLIYDESAHLSEVCSTFEKDETLGFDLPYDGGDDQFAQLSLSAFYLETEAAEKHMRFYTETAILPFRLRDDLNSEAFEQTGEHAKPEYLVNGFLPLRGVSAFVSLPGSLKTWTAFDAAVHVSKGLPWLGRKTRPGRVTIVNCDVEPDEARRRLALLGADQRVILVPYSPYSLHDAKFWTELAKTQPNFVVIDSLSGGSPGIGELDSSFAEPLRRATRFVAENGARSPYSTVREGRDFCSFLFLHHSPKQATPKDVESLFRGTGAVRGAVDSAYYFTRLPGHDPSARVSEAKTRKGMPPDSFVVRMTDESGLQLGDERAGKGRAAATKQPEGDTERLFAFVVDNPGTNTSAAAKALRRRLADVVAARNELGARLRIEGKGKATRLFAAG